MGSEEYDKVFIKNNSKNFGFFYFGYFFPLLMSPNPCNSLGYSCLCVGLVCQDSCAARVLEARWNIKLGLGPLIAQAGRALLEVPLYDYNPLSHLALIMRYNFVLLNKKAIRLIGLIIQMTHMIKGVILIII